MAHSLHKNPLVKRRALVIGNAYFDHPDLNCLSGVVGDREEFGKTFSGLGFRVTVKADLTENEMRQTIKTFASKIQQGCEYTVVAISSHGGKRAIGESQLVIEEDNFICGKDYGRPGKQGVAYSEIMECFYEENCGAMKDKPMIYFFDCCRGFKNMDVVRVPRVAPGFGRDEVEGRNQRTPRQTSAEAPQKVRSMRNSVRNNVIRVCATPVGYTSFDMGDVGCFTHHLCEVISENHEKDDLLTMLQEVAKKVAETEIWIGEEKREIRVGQVSNTEHMLCPKIFF